MRTRVKICGMTREEDALAAAALGVDALGLVFYPRSPRAVTVAQAQAIVHRLPPFVSVVGLFVDAAEREIQQVLEAVPVDLLQFHGAEPAADCGGFGRPYLKAIRMCEGIDLEAEATAYPDAAGLLLDSYLSGQPGGTGTVFDWNRIPSALRGRILLAGGLGPENVVTAIRQVRPYAVDVSGGVERNKGIKDREKMVAFMRGVRRGDDS